MVKIKGNKCGSCRNYYRYMARTFSNCFNKKLQTGLKERWNQMGVIDWDSLERSKQEIHNQDPNEVMCMLWRNMWSSGWNSGQNARTQKPFQEMTQWGCGHSNKWLSWSRDAGRWSSIILRHVSPQSESNGSERREWDWKLAYEGWESFSEFTSQKKKKRAVT